VPRHGAGAVNLEVPGYRYSRISNPTSDILERRVTEPSKAAVESLECEFGANRAVLRGVERHGNGPQHHLGAAALRHDLHPVCAYSAEDGRAGAFRENPTVPPISSPWSTTTRARYFAKTVGNPAGNVCDLEALAARSRIAIDSRSSSTTRSRPRYWCARSIYGADVIVHSLTKFMGGHGTTLGGIVVDCGTFSWKDNAARYPMFTQPDESYHGLVYTDHYGAAAFIAAAAACTSAPWAPCSRR